LDEELVNARSRFKHYRTDMNQGVKQEMDGLRQSLLTQLVKMQSQTYSLQTAVKNLQKDPSWQPGEDAKPPDASKPLPTLRQVTALQPQKASETTKMSKATVQEVPSGPGQPVLESGTQPTRAAAIERLHEQLGELNVYGTRVQTFYNLKFQQLRQFYEEDIHRISATLSSNNELWESVSEGRERKRLISDEISRAQRRCDQAVSATGQHGRNLIEHEEALHRFAAVKEKLGAAYRQLQAEMRKYEQDGLVDVSKMESDSAKLDGKLQQLFTMVPAEQMIAVLQKRDRGERRRLVMQKHYEAVLLQKSAAKVHVIRTELEKGHQEREEEPLLDLLIDECDSLAKQAAALEKENKELQERLLMGRQAPEASRSPTPKETFGGRRRSSSQRKSSTASDQRKSPMQESAASATDKVWDINDKTFEEKLCFGVTFLKTPRGGRKQIDQTHGGPAVLSEPSAAPKASPRSRRASVNTGSAYPERLPPAEAKPAFPEAKLRSNLGIPSQPAAGSSSGDSRMPQHLSPVSSTEMLPKP